MTRDDEGRLVAMAIYDSPPEWPGHIVVREIRLQQDGTATGLPWQGFAIDSDRDAALERAREVAKARLPDAVCVPREDADEPMVVESWL